MALVEKAREWAETRHNELHALPFDGKGESEENHSDHGVQAYHEGITGTTATIPRLRGGARFPYCPRSGRFPLSRGFFFSLLLLRGAFFHSFLTALGGKGRQEKPEKKCDLSLRGLQRRLAIRFSHSIDKTALVAERSSVLS